jgi:hypothetical protein
MTSTRCGNQHGKTTFIENPTPHTHFAQIRKEPERPTFDVRCSQLMGLFFQRPRTERNPAPRWEICGEPAGEWQGGFALQTLVS